MPSGGASGPAPDETPAASAQSSIDEPTLDHAIVADGLDGPIATYAGDKSSANCSKVGLHLDEDEVAVTGGRRRQRLSNQLKLERSFGQAL